MINIPLALRVEKNKVSATSPWVMLLSLTLPSSSVVRLTSNGEDVVFSGNTFQSFPFDLGVEESGNDKSIQSISLTVSNVTRVLQPYMEEFDGLVGCAVSISAVHTDNLSEDYTALTLDYQILTASSDEESVRFTLGQPNLIRKRFPLYQATPNHCPWKFKSASCGYSGADSSCKNTLDDCRDKSNSARFGGRPGLQSPGFKYL